MRRAPIARVAPLLALALAAAAPAALAVGLDDTMTGHIAMAPAAELPARVAEAVRQLPDEAADIACDIVALRTEAAVAVAEAAARAAPEAAAEIASCATGIAPERAAAIAAAVAAAAPAHSEAVVEAACMTAPEAAGEIAEAVARALPDRADAIRAAAEAALARLAPATAGAEPPDEEAPPQPPPPPAAAPDGGAHGAGPGPAADMRPAVRHTGGRLLFSGQAEEPGYGLYSYLLFRRGDGAGIALERRKAVLRAFVEEVSPAAGLEAAGVARREINVLYAPVKAPAGAAPQGPDAVYDYLLAHYDIDRSRLLLDRIGLTEDGPYLVSGLTPLGGGAPVERGRMLVQDLSRVPPRLAGLWMTEFQRQAARQDFWDGGNLRRFALLLRTEIANLSEAFAVTREAVAGMIEAPQ